MIIIFSNGRLEFECYFVRFNSNILEFYFLLVYFSSCVVRLILKFNHEYIFFIMSFGLIVAILWKKISKQNILSKNPSLKKKTLKNEKTLQHTSTIAYHIKGCLRSYTFIF